MQELGQKISEYLATYGLQIIAAAADYWKLTFDLTERVKLEFDKQGISIPYPQRDVHIKAGEVPGSREFAMAGEQK